MVAQDWRFSTNMHLRLVFCQHTCYDMKCLFLVFSDVVYTSLFSHGLSLACFKNVCKHFTLCKLSFYSVSSTHFGAEN